MGRHRRHPNVDWHLIARQYIEGQDTGDGERLWPSAAELAAAHDLPVDTVKSKQRVGAWSAKREEFQAELDADRRRVIFESRKEQIVDIDRRALTGVQAGIALVGTRLNMLVTEATGAQGARKIDARELTALGLAAKRFMEVKAIITGQPVTGAEETVEQAEIEARRLELAMAERMEENIRRRAEPLDDEVTATG